MSTFHICTKVLSAILALYGSLAVSAAATNNASNFQPAFANETEISKPLLLNTASGLKLVPVQFAATEEEIERVQKEIRRLEKAHRKQLEKEEREARKAERQQQRALEEEQERQRDQERQARREAKEAERQQQELQEKAQQEQERAEQEARAAQREQEREARRIEREQEELAERERDRQRAAEREIENLRRAKDALSAQQENSPSGAQLDEDAQRDADRAIARAKRKIEALNKQEAEDAARNEAIQHYDQQPQIQQFDQPQIQENWEPQLPPALAQQPEADQQEQEQLRAIKEQLQHQQRELDAFKAENPDPNTQIPEAQSEKMNSSLARIKQQLDQVQEQDNRPQQSPKTFFDQSANDNAAQAAPAGNSQQIMPPNGNSRALQIRQKQIKENLAASARIQEPNNAQSGTGWQPDRQRPGVEYIDTPDGYKIYQATPEASYLNKAWVAKQNLVSGFKSGMDDPKAFAARMPDDFQNSLDVMSVVPGVGTAADGMNAGVSGARAGIAAINGDAEKIKENLSRGAVSLSGAVTPGLSGGSLKAAKNLVSESSDASRIVKYNLYHGKIVNSKVAELENKGYRIVQGPSFADACSGNRCKPDIIYRDNSGKINIIEIKTGDADLSIRQSEIYPQIMNGDSIPKGAIADDFGLEVGVPLKLQGYPNGINIEVLRYPGLE